MSRAFVREGGNTPEEQKPGKDRGAVFREKKQVYYDIPAVPLGIYYFTIKGKQRSLLCTGYDPEKRKVYLSDLGTGYPYMWHAAHFSYMIRKCSWKAAILSTEPVDVTVKHAIEKDSSALRSRTYSDEEINSVISDLGVIEL